MLRGEALVWLYGLVLFDAIFMLEQDLISSDPASLLKDYDNKLSLLRGNYTAPGNPKYCGPYHCERPPICYTDFKPHYYAPAAIGPNSAPLDAVKGGLTLNDVLVGERSWKYDAAEYSPWSLEFGYLDAKPIYEAAADYSNKEMHILIDLRFAERQPPLVWVCGMPKEVNIHAFLHVNVASTREEVLKSYTPPSVTHNITSLDEVKADKGGRYVWDIHKRKVGGTDCEEAFDLPPKQIHVLSIAPYPDNKHTARLSHVVYFL